MNPERCPPPAGRPLRAQRTTMLGCIGLLGLVGLPPPTAQAAPPPGLAPQQVLLVGAWQGLEMTAVPGKDTDLGFAAQCFTSPPGGWCRGGNLVARFTDRPTQFIKQARTDAGASCSNSLYYLSCPLAPSPDRGIQRVSFTMYVEPQEYSANAGTAEGADGLPLALTPFVIDMRGEGSLDVEPPRDIVLPEDSASAVTTLFFGNAGPSMNRNVKLRFGPFPDHLHAHQVTLAPPCEFTAQRMLECGPVDLMPQDEGYLTIHVFGIPDLYPPLPAFAEIDVAATSDLADSATRFQAAVVPADPGRN